MNQTLLTIVVFFSLFAVNATADSNTVAETETAAAETNSKAAPRPAALPDALPDVVSNEAEDTLNVAPDESADAQQCLNDLKWTPSKFKVTATRQKTVSKGYDYLVRFPSAIPSGKKANDTVSMEWYLARDKQDQVIKAPAMIVVHESGGGMHVGRLFARGFQAGGIHAFMIHLPYYGERQTRDKAKEGEKFIAALAQSGADVRRARDAVAVLPHVDTGHIGVQGTSLGGFVTTTAASLDDRFDSVFILLAGADLYDVIANGQMDARAVRRSLARSGYSGDKLKQALYKVEPSRIAHRLNTQRTWLYSATKDRVVPIKNGNALAKVANLPDDRHIKFNANHYSGIIYFPMLIKGMARRVNESLQ